MGYFSNVVGQTAEINRLLHLVEENKLPHSLLFYGDKGLGKLSAAIGLASTLVGRQVFSSDAGKRFLEESRQARTEDGEGVKAISESDLPIYVDKGDAFWLRPIKKTLSINQWHQLLDDYLQLADEAVRVVIIEDFQTANAVFANAILKTIEEPPGNVYFMLLTTKPSLVLPTIWSRCMAVPFRPVEDKLIKQLLLDKQYTGAIDSIVAASQGNPARALRLAETGSIDGLDLALDCLRILRKSQIPFARLSLRLENVTNEELMTLFTHIQGLLRDLEALRFGAPMGISLYPMYRQELASMLTNWPPKAVQQAVQAATQAQDALRLHIKNSLVVDGFCLAVEQVLEEERRGNHNRYPL